jgi:hypothetical protein
VRVSLFYCVKDIYNAYVSHGLQNVTNNFKKIIGNDKKMVLNKVWYK